MSGVIQHIPEKRRGDAINKLNEHLNKNGQIVMTVRCGPPDQKRGMYSVNTSSLKKDFLAEGLEVKSNVENPDSIGRNEIS